MKTHTVFHVLPHPKGLPRQGVQVLVDQHRRLGEASVSGGSRAQVRQSDGLSSQPCCRRDVTKEQRMPLLPDLKFTVWLGFTWF